METILMLDAENIGWRHFERWAELNKAIVQSAEIRRAYGDFSNKIMDPWDATCHKYGITRVLARHQNKNQADMHLTADALELLYTQKPQTIVLISGDCDYLPMLSKFRSKLVRVVVVAHSNHAAGLRTVADSFMALDSEVNQRLPYAAAHVLSLAIKRAQGPISVAALPHKCRVIQHDWDASSLGQPLLAYLRQQPDLHLWLAKGKGPTAWLVARREVHG